MFAAIEILDSRLRERERRGGEEERSDGYAQKRKERGGKKEQ